MTGGRDGGAGRGCAGRLLAEAGRVTALEYIRDGAAIYARSFAIIRAEADLGALLGRRRRRSRCG